MDKATVVLIRVAMIFVLVAGVYLGYQTWVQSVYNTANQAIQRAQVDDSRLRSEITRLEKERADLQKRLDMFGAHK